MAAPREYPEELRDDERRRRLADGAGARAATDERDPAVGVSVLRGGAPPLTAVVADYIDEHRSGFGVAPICTVLQVAPNTDYAAKARP